MMQVQRAAQLFRAGKDGLEVSRIEKLSSCRSVDQCTLEAQIANRPLQLVCRRGRIGHRKMREAGEPVCLVTNEPPNLSL